MMALGRAEILTDGDQIAVYLPEILQEFTDFLRVGIPLTIIMWLGFSFVLPALYEL